MKKGLIFVLGMITGCLLTCIVLFFIGRTMAASEETNVTYSEQPVTFTEASKFEVFQVLENGALAHCEEHSYGSSSFFGPIVYLMSDGQNLYYDEQVIAIPKGKRAMQVGTYKYQSQMGVKTVPALKIE